MKKIKNTLVTLAHTPEKFPIPSDFEIKNASIGKPEKGQVLCETQYLSLDPYMRIQISGRYLSGNVKPGDMMQGETISKVIESTDSEFSVGDLVRCFSGWQKYSLHQPSELTKIPHMSCSVSAFLSVLGMPGLTAYAGLICQAKPKKGDVVVIPAATGGVGATAGQLAKIYGCRVIGIAGGEKKCRIAVEKLGYDACIDRQKGDVSAMLKNLCPRGINIYFDLVGGELLNAVSEQLAVGARVILCGMMSELNGQARSGGPHPAMWIKARATVFGLVVYDFENKRDEFIQECQVYLSQKKLIALEEITQGIEHAPQAFCRLMHGENIGKVIIKVA